MWLVGRFRRQSKIQYVCRKQRLDYCESFQAAYPGGFFSFNFDGCNLQPVSIQLITPVLILSGLYFIPPSPRWLLYKGRRDEAIAVLESVRPKKDVAAGLCVEEANAIEESIREEATRRKSGTGEKLGWLDLFKGSNLRRTIIATMGGFQVFLQLYVFNPELFHSLCISATHW